MPLRLANYRFVLYKVIALPTQILNDTFIQYSLDFPYIRIDGIQRNYILLTETELKLYTESGITMCPANRAIFSTRVITCESSLFFSDARHSVIVPEEVISSLQNTDLAKTQLCMDFPFSDSSTSFLTMFGKQHLDCRYCNSFRDRDHLQRINVFSYYGRLPTVAGTTGTLQRSVWSYTSVRTW